MAWKRTGNMNDSSSIQSLPPSDQWHNSSRVYGRCLDHTLKK